MVKVLGYRKRWFDMGKVDQIKKEKGFATSELMFGTSPQMENQCPVIDDIISDLHSEASTAKDNAYNLRRMDEEDFHSVGEESADALSWIDFNLRGMDTKLDQLRDNIVLLRSWGEEWKNIALNMAEEVPDINDFI